MRATTSAVSKAALLCLLTWASTSLLAQTPALPTADQTDPVKLGWMTGSPPAADKVIRFADGSSYRFPQFRWSFSNYRQLAPTTNVSRGLGAPSLLPRAERDDLNNVSFMPLSKIVN